MSNPTLEELATSVAEQAQRLDLLTKALGELRENVHRNNNLHMQFADDVRKLWAQSRALDRSIVALEGRVKVLRHHMTLPDGEEET